MNRLFRIVPLFLFLIFFTHCTGNKHEGQHPQILRVALFDNPTNLDPRTYSDAVSYRIIELVYDFLVRMDSTGLPQPQLAERIDTPSDTVYLFTLRKGVKFHDGSPLSAYDAAYTIQSILDPALKAPLRATLQNIRRVTVLDSFHLKITLKEPHAPFLADLQIGIVPRHLVESGSIDIKREPLGSGPFKFVKWESDAVVELERNEHYWKGSPKLEKLVLKILPESTTRLLALQNREIDILINNIPETQLPLLEKDPRFKVIKRPGSNYVYLGLNLRNQYLQNRKVRQAIAYAIDVDGMIKNLLGGLHKRANSLLSETHWAYHPNLKTYQYDPALAKQLLDEAGFTDPDGDGPQSRFSLTYKCTDKLPSRQKAQVIQQYLKQVGIDVKIQSYEWGTFFDDIQQGRFDMFSLSIVGIYEPAVYEQFFHSRSIGNGKNRVGYHNPEVDRLIDLGNRTLDIEKRKQIYWRIQEIVQEDLPYISLWHETNVAVMDKHLFGFEMYPAGEWVPFYKMEFK